MYYFAQKVLSQSQVQPFMYMLIFLSYLSSFAPGIEETSSSLLLHLLPHGQCCIFQHQRKGSLQFASLSSSSRSLKMLIMGEKQRGIKALIKLCLVQALDSDSE